MTSRDRQAYAHRKSDDFTKCSDCKRGTDQVELFITPDSWTWQFAKCGECWFEFYGEYPKGYYPDYDYDEDN